MPPEYFIILGLTNYYAKCILETAVNAESILVKLIKPAQKTTGLLRFLTSIKALLIFLPLGLAIWGIWVAPQLNILPTIVIDSNTPYLLSAIAQSLAAVLALVFTISLIAVQLSSRYSYRLLADFFDPFTIAYMLLFIIAVILPFCLLANPSLNGLKLSIVLAAVCLVSLVPYFLGFREKLSPEHMLLNLKKRALKQLLANPEMEPASVITIDNTIMSAFALKDYDTFGKGVEVLAGLALEAGKRESEEVTFKCIASLYDRLENIALVTMEDLRAPKQVVQELGRTGMNAIRNGLVEETDIIVSRLWGLGLNAVKKGLDDVAGFSVIYLGLVGYEVADKGWKETTAHTTDCLNYIGVGSAKQGMSYACSEAITFLGNIGLRSLNTDWENLVRYVVRSLVGIGVEVKKIELTDEIKEVGYRLVELGACALHKRDTELSTEIADALKQVHDTTLVNILPFAFWKAKNYASVNKYYTATKEDLDEFAKLFQWPEGNNNVG